MARDLFWIGAVSGHVRGKSVPPRGREFIGRFPYALFAGIGKNIRVGREYTLLFYFNLIFLFSLFQLPVARFPFAMPSPPTARCPPPKVACRTVA